MGAVSGSTPELAAYVYPGWHRSPYRPGIDEWSLLDDFRPYFDGHAPPPRPSGGRYDDTLPETARRHVGLALEHGIERFTYFLYFRAGGFVMDEPVRAAFHEAGTGTAMRLALTLCLRLPHQVLPLPTSYGHWRFAATNKRRPHSRPDASGAGSAPEPDPTRGDVVLDLLSAAGVADLSLDDVRRLNRKARLAAEIAGIDAHPSEQRQTVLATADVITLFELWADRWASQPHHWRIQDRPVCSLLNVADFCSTYGVQGFRLFLALARGVFRRRLGVDPFVIGVVGEATTNNADLVRRLPLDAVTGYALLPEWSGPPTQDYGELMVRRVREWQAFQRRIAPLPFLPVACCGWDASVRGEWAGQLLATRGFPWRPIVTGVTPALFRRFLEEAVAFNRMHHPELNVVFLHAWNEWTESAAIEPSDRFGSALLEAVQLSARCP
jgi:hypothetical protein